MPEGSGVSYFRVMVTAGLNVAPEGVKLYARIRVELSVAADGDDSVPATSVPCREMAVLAAKLSLTLPSLLAISLAVVSTPLVNISESD